MNLVTLGEILIDMFPSQVGPRLAEVAAFHPKPGGAPANVAVAAARLGAKTAFIGKVGDDAFGHHLIDVLAVEGVETRGMRLDQATRTTLAFIAMPDEHTAEYIFYRQPGADLQLRSDELDEALLRSTRGLHVGSLSLVAEPARSATFAAVRLAAEQGALISFDVNYRPSLWPDPGAALAQIEALIPLVDVIKVNEMELALLAGHDELATGASSILSLGPSLCVVTLGPDGAYYQLLEGGAKVPGYDVATVDAVGCGDAFVGALLAQLTGQPDWRDQLRPERLMSMLGYANAVGALTALKPGAIPALPTAEEVAAFVNRES